jgi:hypothetical protein
MSERDSKDGQISRRDFTRRAALVVATAGCLPPESLGRPATPPEAQGTPPQGDKLSTESLDEVRVKIQSIQRKHGDRLSEAQKADIGRLVEEGQKSLEALRAFPLDNSDQPGNILRLYPDSQAIVRTTSR